MQVPTKPKNLPCPFCGKNPYKNEKHEPDCFLSLWGELQASKAVDMELVLKVSEAWNKRVAPNEYCSMPLVVPKNFAEMWEKHRQRVGEGAADPEEVQHTYRQLVDLLKI